MFQLSSLQLTYNFNVTIVNDGMVEVQEDFSVNLTHVTQEGGINITPDMATVSIADDDSK